MTCIIDNTNDNWIISTKNLVQEKKFNMSLYYYFLSNVKPFRSGVKNFDHGKNPYIVI